MKTLFQKDLRENFILALLGMAIFALLIILVFRSSADATRQTTIGLFYGSQSPLQPLLSLDFQMQATFFCASFGAVLGWLQTRNEAHRDLWAFLIHRPITRTGIFWGKVTAGLCLYLLGAGLPLLGMVLFIWLPGHVAAPFTWVMALPSLAFFLTGIAWYFAGLLTGLRQARWSRPFGAGAAVVASVAANLSAEFWQAALTTLLLTAMLAVAVWGAYQSGGFYRGQRFCGKLALTGSLAFGGAGVAFLLAGLTATLFSSHQSLISRSYAMTEEGQIVIDTWTDGEESFTDLNGKPVLDPATGHPFERKEFNQHRAFGLTVKAGFEKGLRSRLGYNKAGRFFTLWNVSQKILWYVDRHGMLTSFNGITGLPAGDLAPRNGSGNDHFIRSEYWNSDFNSYIPPEILATPTTVYQVDLNNRTLKPLFAAIKDDPILGFVEAPFESNAVVLTQKTIRMTDFNGKALLLQPYQPGPIAYPQIEVLELQSNRFALWSIPDNELNQKSNWTMPTHVVWISPAGDVAKTADLPTLHDPKFEATENKIFDYLAPPALRFFVADDHSAPKRFIFVIPSALCLIIGCWLVRRYHFTRQAAAGWLLFILLFGIPALLAFLCAQEWPKREPCPVCKKPRLVDREKCEHCGAAFAPPEKIGIEIFEPLGSA